MISRSLRWLSDRLLVTPTHFYLSTCIHTKLQHPFHTTVDITGCEAKVNWPFLKNPSCFHDGVFQSLHLWATMEPQSTCTVNMLLNHCSQKVYNFSINTCDKLSKGEIQEVHGRMLTLCVQSEWTKCDNSRLNSLPLRVLRMLWAQPYPIFQCEAATIQPPGKETNLLLHL